MSDDDDFDAEIIPFPERTGDPNREWGRGPIETKPRDFGPQVCPHLKVLVDEKLRTVECQTCKQKLDPISVLLDWRVYWRQIQSARASLRVERERFERARARRKTRKQ